MSFQRFVSSHFHLVGSGTPKLLGSFESDYKSPPVNTLHAVLIELP